MSTTTGDAASIAGIEDIDGECGVRVFVRIRPLNKRELAEKQVIEWQVSKTSIEEATPNGKRQYAYDSCFGVSSTNSETYELVGKPVVIKAMEGYNGTVFTYGQTGSGKTWTMRGNSSDPGMMILCLDDIFSFIDKHQEKRYLLKVSYMEVYNEDINDLLYEVDPNLSKEEREKEEEKHRKLRIATEDAFRGAVIENLTEKAVSDKAQALAVLELGESNRSYAATSMNDTSSRSHVIYRLAITIFEKDVDDDEDLSFVRKGDEDIGRVSYMNLVDLAGSERQKSTNASGKTLKEGANINKSLLALGAVINKLVEASKKPKGQKAAVFIPYRDSKLTRILKQSLGGNTLTSILCTISPAPMFREETVSTLKFGQLCKMIKNQVQSNVVHDDKSEMRRLNVLVREQKLKIEELESRGGGGVDNRAELMRAFRDKKRLEAVVEALQDALKAQGGDPALVQSTCLEAQGCSDESFLDDFTGGMSSAQSNDNMLKIKMLEAKLSEYNEIDSEREDLELQKREYEKEREKLERDLAGLAKSREQTMTDIETSRDQEAKAQKLLDTITVMNSKIHSKMNDIKSLEDRWKGQVADLKKMEDRVKEWEKSYRLKDENLEKQEAVLKSKNQDHSARMAELAKEDLKHKAIAKELEDRKLKLEVTLSKIGQKEDERVSAEERLQSHDSELKRREADLALREREIHSRKREQESWDALLTEKDRNILSKQREMDERETKSLDKEEKLNQAKLQMDKKLLELRQNEQSALEKTEDLTNRIRDLQSQEAVFLARLSQHSESENLLKSKEDKLNERERQLAIVQARMSGIDLREKELNERFEEHKRTKKRYEDEVGQISAKHRREIQEMEVLVKQQSKIIENFKLDLDRFRAELLQKSAKNLELENMLRQRDAKEEQLRAELLEKTSGISIGMTAGSVQHSPGDESFFDPRSTSTANTYTRVSEEDSGSRRGAPASYGKSYTPQTQQSQSSKNLMRRLADSQRALFHILETNMASPHVS